jgi:hypothetical protein
MLRFAQTKQRQIQALVRNCAVSALIHKVLPIQVSQFGTRDKQAVQLNSEWEKMAQKELKTKDVKSVLVRDTNEQMLIKPVYTQEDW